MHLHPSTSTASLWVFGYGSLIWNPGFSYAERRKAHARGYARRMYQGNTYHRGDDSLPGRVATLVESPTEDANGVAFRVEGTRAIDAALKHLNEREVGNGYVFKLVRVAFDLSESSSSRASSTDGSSLSSYSDSEEEERREGPDYQTSFLALTCIAHSSNEFFLGPAHPQEMAAQIGAASGKAGPNHEYVLKLAENIRSLFPRTDDSHLFGLEKRVREIVKRERRHTV
ncbi:hypothetical protein PENTCL1PPCAC_3516 [Pristionchus entomophagus]|uniref:glutathione-specific gamma-glutamylcyclotransferase n=1 Tax=Pristionchus entomophagus TaxID=358040 RepID=A0AAV5SD94_9BILA|nr:hypothetical protein PENTCL1PPCAC_3516 [Pristionchus entomophagus]